MPLIIVYFCPYIRFPPRSVQDPLRILGKAFNFIGSLQALRRMGHLGAVSICVLAFGVRLEIQERKFMFNKSGFFATVVVFTCLLGVPAANAQPACYTLASLQGSYAVVVNYGANVATAQGQRFYDGKGNLNGTFIINAPKQGSTTGERTLTTGTQTGTYTVNCDGTGTMVRVVKAANGVTVNTVDDFVITGAIVGSYSQFLATALVDTARLPSLLVPGGLFINRSYTRLPDRGQE